ncbi:sensor histidine kinase [Cohnella fermenti]|uniref:Sensor histidine kinase n=1 Tax=Cohnella fermenti TaxID=2565925 RepID=A0A4S4BMN3_9BACL|nr:sensor histidine kinase [Cohnella fermenti]THF76096.1 sensor histidine kinase [Cohnella fermenti]
MPRWSMPLYTRLLLSFLIAIIVPSLFVGLFSYGKVSSAIEEEVTSSVKTTIQQVNLNLKVHIDQAVELSTTVYINSLVQSMLGNRTKLELAVYQDDIKQLQETIANITNYQKLYTIRLFYRDVGQFPSGFDIGELRPIGSLESAEAYREATERLNGMYWTADALPIERASDEPEITLIRRIRSMTDERDIGAMTISLPETRIWDIVRDVKIGQTGFVFLIDDSGRIVSHYNKELLGQSLADKPYFGRIRAEGQSGDFRIGIDGTTYLFVYQAIEGTTWKLVGFVDTKELRSRIEGIKVAAIVSALVCFGLAIVYSVYTSSRLARRIGNLIKAMRKLEGGLIGVQAKPSRRSNDEISQLYDHFNRMSSELKDYVEEIGESNKRARTAEMKALQHQINPHFLYNTLDAINWMAATRYKARDISSMVTSLARLFRLSLNKDKEEMALASEIEHVECYVAIQQIRFDNEFSLDVAIEPGLEREPVIKLILQPLVENAILHGFEGIDYPGLIRIEARKNGHAIEIRILDNGVGCDAAAINRMLEEPAAQSADESSGYGLRNVNERIKLYYGPAYGLTFRAREDGASGTVVEVRLAAGIDGRGGGAA